MRCPRVIRDRAAFHPEWFEDSIFYQPLERFTGSRRHCLGGDYEPEIAISELVSKFGNRLNLSGTGEHVAPAQIGAILTDAGPGKSCSIAEHIPDSDVVGNPGIMESKRRQIFSNRIIPGELTLIHQDRGQSGGKCFRT